MKTDKSGSVVPVLTGKKVRQAGSLYCTGLPSFCGRHFTGRLWGIQRSAHWISAKCLKFAIIWICQSPVWNRLKEFSHSAYSPLVRWLLQGFQSCDSSVSLSLSSRTNCWRHGCPDRHRNPTISTNSRDLRRIPRPAFPDFSPTVAAVRALSVAALSVGVSTLAPKLSAAVQQLANRQAPRRAESGEFGHSTHYPVSVPVSIPAPRCSR